MELKEQHLYEFGPFRLQPGEHLLLRDGQAISLAPKVFDTLLVLVQNSGHLLDKDELLRLIWPDTFVEEGSLAKNVFVLRKILEEGQGGKEYIETIPKRGYRFVAPVREVREPIVKGPLEGESSPFSSDAFQLGSNAGLRVEPVVGSGQTLSPAGSRRRVAWMAGLLVLLIGAVATWRVRFRIPSSSPPPTSPMKIVPLTTLVGNEFDPSFSPDGNQVAFWWSGEKNDNADIYVKLIGSETQLQLTKDPAADNSPVWSPDGRWIAFHRQSATETGVYIVPSLGGPVRQLASVNRISYFSWFLDCKSLAFVDRDSAEEPYSIFRVSIETRERRRLTYPPAQTLGDVRPAISPNGETLAFIRCSSTCDLYLTPIGGGEVRQLTELNDISELAWSPDGSQIIFSRRGNLWRLSVSGGEVEPIAAAGQGVGGLTLRGNRLAYAQTTVDRNIWQVDLNGSKTLGPRPVPVINSTRNDDSPQFSPDGKKIVFVSDRSDAFEIWLCDRDGQNLVQLTRFDGPLTGTPRWAPDGRQIAFDTRSQGNPDIWIVSLDGGQPRRLTNEPSQDIDPSWSRDGRWIYFGSNRSGRLQIWKMPAEGGPAVQLTKDGGFEGFESLDGKFFYYAKGRRMPGIWRIPVEGGEETLVLDEHKAGYWRSWAVSDKGIYFATAEVPAHPLIEFYSFATGHVTLVCKLDKPIPQPQPGLSVSPDGRWLLFTQQDQIGSDIMLMENFR
jgi:Tol biopolymer transport system component/DNA-binding winged helix-turn-helix (wHTH) protein